jgi:hypothetical protein
MPGSSTTPGHMSARAVAPIRVAFHMHDRVGPRDIKPYAAQWLAYALPYRRFADTPEDILPDTPVNACARLGADAVRYSFIVADFHHLLLAGLTGAPCRIFFEADPVTLEKAPDRGTAPGDTLLAHRRNHLL